MTVYVLLIIIIVVSTTEKIHDKGEVKIDGWAGSKTILKIIRNNIRVKKYNYKILLNADTMGLKNGVGNLHLIT